MFLRKKKMQKELKNISNAGMEYTYKLCIQCIFKLKFLNNNKKSQQTGKRGKGIHKTTECKIKN